MIVLRRLLALVILFSLPVFAAFVIVKPLSWLALGNTWRDSARRQLAEDQAWAASAERIHERLAALESSREWQRFYPAVGSDEGTAMLLTDLRGVLARGGVNATSAIQLDGGTGASPVEVGARIVAVMVAPQLRQVLQEIETHSRFLEIRRLAVSAPPFQQAQENPDLMVTLEVVGFLDPRMREGAS